MVKSGKTGARGVSGVEWNAIKWSPSYDVRSGRKAEADSDLGKCSRRGSRQTGDPTDHWLFGYNVS